MPSKAGFLEHPIRSLITCFVSWKTLLLLIATCSPGQGYDTSTSLLLSSHDPTGAPPLPVALHYLVSKLTRWDAIYYVRVANRGYLFEQEWAFGWGFTSLINLCTAILLKAGIPHYHGLEGLVAVCIAHTAHLLSVLVLFKLTAAVFPSSSSTPGLALTASLLHIISPAGLFLSSPFAESSCALLSFLGCYLFTKSVRSGGQPTIGHDLLVFASGVVFGLATTLRSNGIFNGLLLLEEALRNLFYFRSGPPLVKIRRLVATGLGGLCVGAGFLLPQYIAYSEYCTQTSVQSRPWCEKTLPSIYTFVQEHYWNVGPFRYWTLSNVPLFLLATPMLLIMTISGVWALSYESAITPGSLRAKKAPSAGPEAEAFPVLRNLAVTQILLTLLTFTTAHVQIITRISSAYPIWMWFLAMSFRKGNSSYANSAVRIIVMYGIIQAGLLASFLPPA